MGKKKNAKGTTRPSSSSHSAELLSGANGAPPTGLIGFQNYPREVMGHKTLAGSHEEDSSGSVRVIMKMMLKKDVVTKLKGIQEFISSCAGDTEQAMQLLPIFPRIYNKLALEPDKRVREAIQRALEVYISKLKKDTVPYLKSFMATWLITQCDPHTPAAVAAQSAFSKSFPEHRQSDAVMYCQSEILKVIKDNLCEVTEDSLSESGGLSEDVCKEKYELILVCSVRGLKLFVSLLSEEDKKKTIKDISCIVNEEKFWAHSQNTVNKVRVAWYELLHVLISEMPEVFQETKCKLISLVMSSLWKSASQVIGSVWDCALQTVTTFEDWWQEIDIANEVFSPLFEFLKSGGYGNASVVYPMLQEFLSKLMITNKIGLSFYMEFFSSIHESFAQYKLKTSPKECDAVIKGYMDCLKYLTNVFLNEPDHGTYVTELVSKQLIPLIKISLKSECCNVAASSFYPLLGLYLKDLEVCMQAGQGAHPDLNNDSHYCSILNFIWENVSLELIEYLQTELEKSEKDVSVLVLLFHSLHHPSRFLAANERKMYFCGESSSTSIDTTHFIVSSSPNLIRRIKTLASCNSPLLFKYTAKFCGHLCLELHRNFQSFYLELCAEIMSEAMSPQLFKELLEALHISVKSVVEAPFIFFKTVIMDWIKCACTRGDEVSLEWIRDIVIYICFCVSGESAVVILEICSEVEHQKLFQRLVMKILASTESTEEIFQRWLQSPTFICVFECMAFTFAKKLISAELNLDSPETALCNRSLMLIFTKAGSEQSEIPRKPVKRILNFFTRILSDECSLNCENQGDYNIIDFVCDAAAKLFFQHPSSRLLDRTEITRFLFRVFTLSIEWPKFNITECHKERRQLDYVWMTSIAYMVQEQSDLNENNFLLMAADHLHDLVLKEMPQKKQKRVIEVVCCFLERIEEAYFDMSMDFSESVLIFLIKRILPSFNEWEEARNGLQLGTVVPILHGNWFYPFVPDECLTKYSVTVPPLLFAADTVAEILRRFWVLVSDKCKRQIQAVYHKLLCSHYLPYVLWSVCYAESLNFFKAQDLSEPMVFKTLRANLAFFMEKCNICQLLTVVSHLLLQDDLMWGIPFERVIHTALNETATPLDYFNTFSFAFNEFRSNYLTVTQICLKYASKEFVMEFLSGMQEDAFDIDCDSLQARKAFYGNLSQLAQCVQEYGNQFVPQVQNKVLIVLEKLVKSDRFGDEYCDDILFVTSFTTLATGVIKNVQAKITENLWYSVIGTISDWFVRSLEVADWALTDSSSLIFVQQTCRLITVMSEVMEEDVEDKAADTSFKTLANVHWRNLFETNISKQLVKLFLQLAGKISDLGCSSDAVDSLLFAVVQTLEYLSAEQIFEAVLFIHSGSHACLDISERIDSAYKMLHELTHYLKSKSMCVQFGIHFLLKKALVHLPKIDKRQKSYDVAENENTFRSSPLVELMAHTNDIVEALLAEVKPTECSILQPFTDSYTYAMANLLAWHIFLEYFSASFTEERSMYVGCLAESKMLPCMLLNVIRLRPENLSGCSGHEPRQTSAQRDELKIDLHEVPPMSSLGAPSSKHLQHIACSVYVAALKKIPALVRTWWSNLDKKTAGIVEKFTSENISKILLLNEISVIHAHKDQFVNMMVDACASSRQVIATYTLDDATIELSIKIPQNYPLGSVVASNKKKTIVDQNQWRTWMFQLTTFLNYHNGSIKDALILWKKNLDKRFEGVEECMICYFILHSSSGTLPNKTCRICKKKFHGSCLFKWFKSSNSCSCPGCRNDF